MSNSNPVQQNQAILDSPETDSPVEIIGYITDPKQVGYQILTNYQSTYWRPLVGNDAWGLYEVLRSFCHDGNNICFPSINLLADILGFKERRVITGWVKTVKGKRYEYQGLIEKLQEHKLVIAEVRGKGRQASYTFHVNLTPSQLTAEQLTQLPITLQKKHTRLIRRCEQALEELEAKRRPPKFSKNDGEETGGDFSGNFSVGIGKLPEGIGKLPKGIGNLPNEHYPYNNTQKTTVVVEKLREYGIQEDKSQEIDAKFSIEYIQEKIEYLEWKLEMQAKGKQRRGRPITDPAGWLVRAIQNDYKPPTAFFAYKENPEELPHQAEEREESERGTKVEQLRQDTRLTCLMEEYKTSAREIELWKQALGELSLQMPKATFNNLFAATQLLAIDDGRAVIAVANNMARDWLEHRLADKISRTLEGITQSDALSLEFVVLRSNNQRDSGGEEIAQNKGEQGS